MNKTTMILSLTLLFFLLGCTTESNLSTGGTQYSESTTCDPPIISYENDFPHHPDSPLSPYDSEYPLNYIGAPPQPIHFDNLDEAITFINNPNLDRYIDSFKPVYERMIARFRNDEYIISLSCKETSFEINWSRFALYPKVRYEDCGVSYWVKYKNNPYYIVIYHADTTLISPTVEELPSIINYLKVRMNTPNIPPERSIELNGHPAYAIFDSVQTNKFIEQFIDSKHYFKVCAGSAEITKEDLLEFVQMIEFEQVPLN